MVVDGRTELASPDMELARQLIRMGKPLLLAVNKMDTPNSNLTRRSFAASGSRTCCPSRPRPATALPSCWSTSFAYCLTPSGSPKTKRPRIVEEEQAEAEDGVPVEADDAKKTKQRGRPEATKVAIIGRPNVGKSTLLNALTGTGRAIVSPIAGTTRDAVDELVEHDGQTYRFIDTAGIRRKGKTELMAEKLSVVMARKHLEAADVALIIIDAVEGVTASDATIAGYAHESGRSVIIVINKWDLVTTARTDGKPPADRESLRSRRAGT